MEEMIKDSTVARDVQVNFEEYLKSNDNVNLGMDLTVTAITPVNRPTYKITDLNLPEEMVRSIEVFKEFNTAKSMNKKLTIVNSLGICHVSGKFESKTIELVVSTAQAALLLLFNTAEKLSYSEILTQLNVTPDDLAHNCKHLAIHNPQLPHR